MMDYLEAPVGIRLAYVGSTHCPNQCTKESTACANRPEWPLKLESAMKAKKL